MKLKYISLLLLSGAATFTMTSCEDFCDDFLTQSNPNEVTTQIFWSNLDECNTGLTAVYKTFSNQNIYLNYQESLRADLGWPGVYPAFTPANSTYYTQMFNDSSSEIGAKWSALYEGIFRANQVIKGLEGIEANMVSDAEKLEWRQIMAQARFFRGLFHFYLNTSFNDGNVPIMNFVPQSESDFLRPSNSSDDVKAFYRADLEYAEANLPVVGSAEEWSGADGNLGRVTSGAATATLGTSYLYDEDYAQARTYFEKIIDNGAYELAATCQDNFGTANEFNSESILEVNYTADYNAEYDLWNWHHLTNTNNLYTAPATNGGWGSMFASYWLYRDFVYEPVDKRNPENKVYLECDEHGDILYYGKKVVTTSTSGGVNYASYPVLPKDSVALGNMTYYLKKVAVDANNVPLVADLSTLSDDDKLTLYTPIMVGDLALRAYSNVQSKEPYTITTNTGVNMKQQNGECWKVYYDNSGKPYRYKVHSDRASSSIVMPTEYDKPYYMYDMSPLDMWSMGNAWCGYRKFSNWESFEDERDVTATGRSAINNRIIRLADVYLMYAEALIEGGTKEDGVNEALKYINRVRRRAGTVLIGSKAVGEFASTCTYQDSSDPDAHSAGADSYTNLYNRDGEEGVISTAEEVMNHLMYKERPLELCLEGHAIRFNDLRRWGILKERFTQLSQMPFQLYGYVFYKSNLTKPAANAIWTWAMDYDTENLSSGVKYEYQDAAANYNDSKAYYPIPIDESTANPEIGTVVSFE